MTSTTTCDLGGTMSVLTLILAGGAGSRLSILGEKRAKPAVPFAGKYRIIDFPLSNAVNSELYRIAVLTQYRPHSLMQHIAIGVAHADFEQLKVPSGAT